MKLTRDPPRLAIWLLTRRLSAEWRDFVVGDLVEEFATRNGDSPIAGRVWFWWQTMRCLVAPPPVRPNRRHRDRHTETRGCEPYLPIFVMRSADCPGPHRSPLPSSACWRSASAPVPRFSASSTRSCCVRCRSRSRNVWCGSTLEHPARTASPSRSLLASSTAGSGMPGPSRAWRCISAAASEKSRLRALVTRGASARQPSVRDFSRPSGPGRRSAGCFGRTRTRVRAGTWSSSATGSGGPNSAPPRDVVGRTVRLNDEPHTIVGVLPANASIASWTGMASDVWIPLALTDEQRAARGNHNRNGVARLKPGVTLGQAQAGVGRALRTVRA